MRAWRSPFGPADLGLGLGLCRPDRGGDQLLLGPRRLELRKLGLLPDDLLRRLRFGQRTGLGGTCLGRRGLRLGLRATEGHIPRCIDLDLLGLGLLDRCLLVGGGFGHTSIAFAAGGLLLTDEFHVTGLVADRLDGERVDLQPRRGEVSLRRVLDGLLELLPIEVQFLDGQRPDDRAQ
jgi:hypothetical protein